VAAVMIGLAVALSAIGLHQFVVSRPADRLRYQRDPEGVLRDAGILAPAGSPTRLLFENRLAASEPTATFSLANSLAGFLAPWLVVALGIATCGIADCGLRIADWESSERWLICGALACSLPLAACLVLTKSRSAWLATALGLTLLALGSVFSLRRQGTQRLSTKAVLVGAVGATALAGLVAAAYKMGALDRQVFTEAFKSLGYRWQYWQGAWAMVHDHFWLGCGLGNFQDEYTRYKLPEASEVVADPHNFVFEVWATAGTLGLIGLLLVIAGAACDLTNRLSQNRQAGGTPTPQGGCDPTHNGPSPTVNDATGQVDLSTYVLAGGALGFLAAYLIGQACTVPLGDATLVGALAVASAAVACLHRWIRDGRLPAPLPWLGAAVLAVNLLAAGGISFPGVAGSLWLLCALGLAIADRRRPRRLSRKAAGAFLACTVAVAAVCSQTAYLPVMRSRMNLLRTQARGLGAAETESLLVDATRADPRSDEPYRQLAAWAFAQWTQRPSPERFARWRKYQDELLRLRPRSSAIWQQAADGYFEAYERLRETQWLDEAIRHYRRAVELYPNQATLRGRLAIALDKSGATQAAAGEAATAIKLDQSTPHADQKLPGELRPELLRIMAAGNYTADGLE
ncbi:MAG TPA: O-antigen ligase family protein, partial [Pirellulales bacterium]|nr:O-antigen ligase family protein [Pirellulales bacterium]